MEVLVIAKDKDSMMINEQIRAREVLVIGPKGEQLGLKPIKDALTLASYAGFDLVLMNPNATPAVCKIMDYNKFKYENKKRQKENLKKYIEFNRDKEEEILTKEDKIRYELILGFRKIKGINKKKFYNKYNIDIHDLYNINELLKKGYLNEDDEYIFIPKEYIYVSNDILINFI